MNLLTQRKQYAGVLTKPQKVLMLLTVLFLVVSVVKANTNNNTLTQNQQRKTISGKITDEQGESIIGASIIEKGTSNGTLSGTDGNFSLSVKNNATVTVSFLGYTSHEFSSIGQSTFNIVLQDDSKSLDEVVVVGYGTQKIGGATVSVERVNMNDLIKAPVRSFDDALAGRVAGVQVISSDGQPGAGTNIIIRGNTSLTSSNAPLYIIDGFPVEDADNNLLDPNDIESIDVLKDASATAIYGSRGANGVILITTKKGRIGKPRVDINASYGIQQTVKKIEMMNAYDFVNLQIERDPSIISGSPIDMYLTRPGLVLEDYKSKESIDWQDQVLRTAPMTNLSVSVTGGNQKTKYAMSGNILSQDGILINSNYSRYSGRLSIDQNINKRIDVGLTANYSQTNRTGIAPSENTGSASTFVMYSIWGYRPISFEGEDIETSLIDPAINPANDYRVNPYINLKNLYRLQKVKNLYSNAYLDYKILPGLKLRIIGGITSYDRRTEGFNNSQTQWGNIHSTFKVNGSVLMQETSTWINENILTYETSFDKHNLALTGVTSAQSSSTSIYGISANFLPNESLGLSGLEQGVTRQPTALQTGWSLLSYVGRINYDYNSIYYLTSSFRTDGSSKFKKQNRWGYFPTLSLAWRFSNEEFLKNSNILSNGKLRFGWGVNGNNRVGDFAAYSSIDMPIAMKYTVGNTPLIGAGPITLGNDNLRWETTREVNFGLDLGFFNERISSTIELYRKTTSDLLLNADLPTSSGYPRAQRNIGTIQNQGLEFTLNVVNFNRKDFVWTTNFNIAFNQNTILKLNDDQDYMLTAIPWDSFVASMPAYISRVGGTIGQMYGFISDGLYQPDDFDIRDDGGYILKEGIATNGNTRANIQPGDIKYRDLNNDKIINADDYTEIGNGFPLHQGGFTNNFRYKNFDLNVFFQWSYGNDVLNVNNMFFNGNFRNSPYLNQYASYTDRWTENNQDAKYHRVGGYFGGGYSTIFVEDASYLRLKTISLGYNLPSNILKSLNIDRCRIHLSAQNLITWTNYSGVDPEVSTYSSALTPGFDWSSYPRAKTVTLGLNISL